MFIACNGSWFGSDVWSDINFRPFHRDQALMLLDFSFHKLNCIVTLIIIISIFIYMRFFPITFMYLYLFAWAPAPVSRIVKYFRTDGTPLITVGGYTFDFVQNKMTCDSEYHMLVRVGLLSFETIAEFMVNIMNA